MFGRTLLVLMWKHAVVRSKKYIYTSVEFIAPLLLFIFMFIFKNTFNPPSALPHSSDVSFLANNEVLDLVKDTEGPPKNILYYPDTNFTNAIMAEVAKSLDIPRIYKMPGEKQKGVFAYPKNTHLGEFISNMEIGDAIVIFQTTSESNRRRRWVHSVSPEFKKFHKFLEEDEDFNFEGIDDDEHGVIEAYGPLIYDYDTEGEMPLTLTVTITNFTSQEMHLPRSIEWPDELNYTIRMKQNFQTQGYMAEDHGPHAMFGLNYLKFMRLQWAIDTAFIKLRSGTPIHQTVHLQEFPFYKTEGSQSIIFIVALIQLSCYLSLLLPFVFLMSRLLEERTSGIQELIKMMGVSLNTLGLSHFLNILPTMLIFSTVVTLLLKVTSNPLLAKTNGLLVFLMLFLYFNSLVALAFVCSYLVAGSEYGVTVSVIGYGLLWLPSHFLDQMCTSSSSYALTIIAGFLPHVPMYWFWKNVRMFEVLGPGLNFSNLTKGAKPCAGAALLVFIMLILQALIFYTLACYLARVRPGKYGQPLPWDFIFKIKKELNKITQVSPPISIIDSHVNKQFWTKKQNEVEPELESDTSLELIEREEQYFEKAPEHLKSGIRIENVSKAYRETLALRDVSLNVYQGEITVLLGHNGAGKTTLMNIITGMTSATKGRVYVNDMDTVTDQAEVRKHIGLCPQHNMFFPDLTLQEHIMFFTLLKRGTFQEARESSRKLAQQLNLEHKLGERVAKLSGGMQRRAQLACALAGGADVLVLDEPTSGLDVETRRELWDLLLALRGSRTVLLSTHFMEEADALGDRVAALHAGVLRCHATTMYLKRAVGDGYRLSLTTIGKPKEREITEEVHKHVPDATKKEKTINSISFTLPAAGNDKFPLLFTDLESKRSELGIDSIGVGISTLDEVFMKLCSDVDTTVADDEVDAVTPGITHERLTGCPLYWRQFMILFKRQIKFALYRKWLFLILQVLLPIVLIFIITDLSNNVPVEPDATRLRMDLHMYRDMGERRVLYNTPMDAQLRASRIDEEYPGVNFQAVDNVAKYVGRIAQFDMESYHKYIVGIEQANNTDAKILYTTTVRHAAPVALNMLTNMLARQYINSPATQISTYNEPVQGFVRAASEELKSKVDELLMFFALFITFFVQATNLHSASLPCRERETGSRHIHIMSGCATELYWFTTLAFHLLIVLLFLVVPIILAVLILEDDNTLNRVNYLGTYSLILLIGSATLFAFIYQTSFYCNERFTNVIQVACLFVFGLVLPLFRQGLDMLELDTNTDDTTGALVTFLSFCWFLMPPYTMMVTALRTSKLARINALCDEVKKDCPEVFLQEPGWDDAVEDRCCSGLVAKPYFCTENKAPMFGIIMLFIQFAVLMTLVVLTQRGVFNGFHDWIRNRKYQSKERDESDKEVNAEKRYVQHEITKPASSIKKDAILVSNVHKNYHSLFRKSCNAVKGINFSVKKGECFGLLGVNGAGKSTTFKMLTAEECVTRGKIFGNGHFLRRGNTEYLQTLGYCPQFFGLDMFLTGVDNLRLILTLRGYTDAQVKSEIENWISIVGLEKYKLRRAETYSGGCRRRLGAASALCGGAPVSLLDEPSAGVDVAARRRLWAALRKALRRGRSIIITSHSMDEMESLCSRIAILCAGRVRALGSPGTLRAQHAAGHAVVLKVKHALGDEVDNAKSEINTLKGKVKQTFNCDLKDEHKTTLHYHINETMRYSDLFATLEALKKEFPSLIEDYSVTETTLEEVFLSLAQETRAEEERQHQV